MEHSYAAVLNEYRERDGVVVRDCETHGTLELSRAGFVVLVAVPADVLEWFVDVTDAAGHRVEDWVDYEAYDETPVGQLESDFARDVRSFLDTLLSSDLSFTVGPSRGQAALQWFRDGEWVSLVPFGPALP